MTEEQQAQQPQLPPVKLAFILEGQVVDILHTDERLSAIFTSNPLIVNVTENFLQENNIVKIGTKWNYETSQFFIEEPIPTIDETEGQ